MLLITMYYVGSGLYVFVWDSALTYVTGGRQMFALWECRGWLLLSGLLLLRRNFSKVKDTATNLCYFSQRSEFKTGTKQHLPSTFRCKKFILLGFWMKSTRWPSLPMCWLLCCPGCAIARYSVGCFSCSQFWCKMHVSISSSCLNFSV